MKIYSFTPWGVEGILVDVFLDIRKGIPGMDIIGLPEGAVREARERIRSSIVKSQYDYPKGRILVNLAPADIRKCQAHHDLPICVSLLHTLGQIKDLNKDILILGELQLDGTVRSVKGVLAAVLKAMENGIHDFIIPMGNRKEAAAANAGRIWPIESLDQLPDILIEAEKSSQGKYYFSDNEILSPYQNFNDYKGQDIVKRAMIIAAAGRHNLLLFGPPGSGKTMAAERLGSLYGPLGKKQALSSSRIWSISGLLQSEKGLLHYPVLRMPHHSASLEGIVGGGRHLQPGEVSLAHNGILLLDEAPEFSARILQGLREPLESGQVSLTRAGKKIMFPADFQLVLTANPCPCGNMGKDRAVCVCSRQEIVKYWKKMGGALLDRVDIRLPVKPVKPDVLLEPGGNNTEDMKALVKQAKLRQEARYKTYSFDCNGRLPPHLLERFCHLNEKSRKKLIEAVNFFNISSRAVHSILKMARTIADIENRDEITEEHIYESIQFRRYGDNDLFWMKF